MSPVGSRERILALLLLFPAGCALGDPGTRILPTPEAVAASREPSSDPHAVLAAELYPSATLCRACHADHYAEWSVSPHAYTQISPVFNAMQGTILKQTSGTLGDFCIRCHTPVGMALGEPLFAANADRAPVSREGVTCIVCHRVNEDFGKNSGRSAILPGDIFQPVYGPRGGLEQERVLAAEEYGVVTEPGIAGRKIHAEARYFEPISTAGACATCHEILLTGFREDESVSEYKQSPAAARGETCQDCHMGRVPGVASGYAHEPAATIGGLATRTDKRTDHMFVGPDHSVVHPGVFPHDPDVQAFATTQEWLDFDHEAGWGTDEFEDSVEEDDAFPERWAWAEDRYEARELLQGQLDLLEEARRRTLVLLRNGFELGEIETTRADEKGLAFQVDVRSATDGHNAPTGFIAERVVFLQVTVTDSEGEVVFRSGDLDPNGDLRDRHSLYVRNGELPVDDQLFTLSSSFVTRNVRGGERPQPLSVNFSLDPLPFVRPDTRPTVLAGRKLSVRIHKRSIEPGGSRRARYEVPGEALTGAPPYSANVKLIVAMVPVHLVDAIKGVGFDYGLSARDVADAIAAGQRVVREVQDELVVR